MRLLEVNSHVNFTLTEFIEDYVPLYAILSHTWGADRDEVALKDILACIPFDQAPDHQGPYLG
jgi:hypothetical protein